MRGIIEGIRVSRRSEEVARAHINISVPIEGNEAAVNRLMVNLRNTIDITFGELQGSLSELVDQPQKTLIVDASGAPVLPHSFRPSPSDENKCNVCGFGESLEVHNDIEAKAQELIDQIPPANDEEAAEQQQAREKLASRSR